MVNPKMQRTKVLAVVAALVSAGAAAIVLAGGASAASWHVYQGDMYPGHAYGLQVPAGAQSIEFALDGAEGATASIAIHAPSGERVAHYALSDALPAVSVAQPKAGQYAVYVYDVKDGALTVRVDSEKQPALELSSVPLAREDVRLGSFPQGRLDRALTADLRIAPVFVTLLYEGSSRGLDATVASAAGTVATITAESATAFAPGVWTSLKGERAFDATNIAGKTYTVEVHAESFEGSLVLTALSLDIRAPETPRTSAPMPPAPPAPTTPTARPVVEGSPSLFALQEGTAVAFQAAAGTLVLVEPSQLEREAAEENGEEYDYGDDCRPLHATITIYAPDDSVLSVVELTHDEPMARVELPVSGEYVAFTSRAQNDFVFATLEGARSPPTLRNLGLDIETFEFQVNSGVIMEQVTEAVTLSHVPVSLSLMFEDGIGTLSGARLENELGVVGRASAPAMAPGLDVFSSSLQMIENFAAGDHELSFSGFYEGTLVLTSEFYVRSVEAPTTHDIEETVESEEAEEPEESDSWLPIGPPPAAPLATPPAAPPATARLLGLTG